MGLEYLYNNSGTVILANKHGLYPYKKNVVLSQLITGCFNMIYILFNYTYVRCMIISLYLVFDARTAHENVQENMGLVEIQGLEATMEILKLSLNTASL